MKSLIGSKTSSYFITIREVNRVTQASIASKVSRSFRKKSSGLLNSNANLFIFQSILSKESAFIYDKTLAPSDLPILSKISIQCSVDLFSKLAASPSEYTNAAIYDCMASM